MGRNERIALAFIVLLLFGAVPLRAERTAKFDSLLAWYKTHYDFTSPDDTIYTFQGEYTMPEGYAVPDSSELSDFANWIQNFPIWHRWKSVGKWDGGKVLEYDQVSRVVHLPWSGMTFKDRAIPIRLLGEYVHYRKRQLDMAVVPPAGVTLTYPVWLTGRPAFNARMELIIKPGTQRDTSDSEYYGYLLFAMSNMTYASLAKNCDRIDSSEIMPGDLYLAFDSTGQSGQVYVILHMIQDRQNDRRYIVATGGTEACDFYIPKVNPDRDDPWLTREDIESLNTGYANAGFYRLHLLTNAR